ncbi:hypothetical protein [Methylibium petroleiphilum]|uniref:hypothetical protein n=1 Tax=Methylibium petroleiphilum TaxID=105560 RepID=UPI001AD08497|nr:hypothetical protein [Methylibium petroleiphilum]MBN9205488.1 hypothetical protein [Methylibium petroleiphilum]
MLEGLSSVTVIDLVIGLTLFEGLALALYHRRTGKGVPVGDFAVNLVSGLCLMLALRAAVADAAWHWIGLWLALAGGAHATDLMRRWRP